MDWIRTDEGTKQKKLNFNPDRNKRGRPQKCKDNNRSSSGKWKYKFRKAIKTHQCLKYIMSEMTTED